MILTSITDVAIRGDLQDRAIAITLPPVPEARRRSESDLWREFRLVAPAILGALLDAACCALRRERDVRLDTLPRMADWAIWTTAAEPALGWPDGAVLAAYTAARQHDVEAGLDGDPLAVAIRALTRPWEGTAAELLTRLTPAARAPRGWPESPRGLASALRRLAPQLRRVGIEVDLGRRVGHERRRVVALEDVLLEDTGGQPSAPSFCPDSLGDPADGHADATSQPGDLRPQPSAQPSALFPNKYGGKTDAADADGRAPIYPQQDAWAPVSRERAKI